MQASSNEVLGILRNTRPYVIYELDLTIEDTLVTYERELSGEQLVRYDTNREHVKCLILFFLPYHLGWAIMLRECGCPGINTRRQLIANT